MTQSPTFPHPRGISGMLNLGNTCYLNSCVHVLNHSYEIYPCFENMKLSGLNRNSDSVVLVEFLRLRSDMFSANRVYSPQKFVSCVKTVAQLKKNLLFSSGNQQDFSEFFMFMITSFHNATKRPTTFQLPNTYPQNDISQCCIEAVKLHFENEYSGVINLFSGIEVSTLSAPDKPVSHTSQPFNVIPLTIASTKQTLYDCLDEYTKKEYIGDGVHKQTMIWFAPQLLVFSMNRFDNFNNKINHCIQFPVENLNISNYMVNASDEFTYDLYAVITHDGMMHYGHYIAYIKAIDDKWYRFNDEKINMVDTYYVYSLMQNAYCLFYRKKQ